MADNETIADIIAEMRRNFADGNPYYAAGLPDRIEAAHKRELARVDAVIDEAVHGYPPEDIYDKRERGDCAKLREALKHIKDRLPHMLQYMRVHWEDASAGGYFDDLMLVIDAALSAPPRNCDLPEVAKDPWRAWLDDKSNWDEDGNPKLEIHDWLLAPATEKEGGNDGK